MMLPIRKISLPALCIAISAITWSIQAAESQAGNLFRRANVWGQFRPGSWVVVRQGTETLDDAGQVVSESTTETRTTLADNDGRCLTFRVQASLEVGGKKLEGNPQELRQTLPANPLPTPDPTAATEETLTIEGRKYPCKVEQAQAIADGRRTEVKTWTSPDAAPFELRRATTIVDVASNRMLEETIVEVIGFRQERRILARSRPVAEVQIVHRHPRGQTTARALNCPEIPGGIVSQISEEFGLDGKLLRRTKVELVDFETK